MIDHRQCFLLLSFRQFAPVRVQNTHVGVPYLSLLWLQLLAKWGRAGFLAVIAKKRLPMVSLLARPSVRAPTATAMSVSSRVLPATRAATSNSVIDFFLGVP